MFNLILSIIGIVLVAALGAATVSYLPADFPLIERQSNALYRGIQTLELAFNAEARASGRETGQGVTLTSNPMTIGVSGDNLRPYYSFVPQAPLNSEWELGIANHPNFGPTYYICSKKAEDTSKELDYKSFIRAGRSLSSDQFFINSTCGATSNIAAPTVFPTTLRATYWLRYVKEIS